jgi:hypothetical protein
MQDFLTSSCTNLNQPLADNYIFNAAKCRYKPDCISQAPVTPKCFQAISRPTQGYCYATTTSFNTCVLNQGEADAYGAAVAQVLVPLDTFAAFFRFPPFLEVENRIIEKGVTFLTGFLVLQDMNHIKDDVVGICENATAGLCKDWVGGQVVTRLVSRLFKIWLEIRNAGMRGSCDRRE